MDLESVKGIYIDESKELLEDMEQALLAMEETPQDLELINRVFRAVHTIKGSGGVFGFDDIVGFAHVLETLMDKVRAGESRISEALIALFLNSKDHLVKMIDALVSGEQISRNETDSLIEKLNAFYSSDEDDMPDAAMPVAHTDEEDVPREKQRYHISIRFGRDTFRYGMDPVSLIRSLFNIGESKSIQCVTEAIPFLDDNAFDPESCHLGFEINLLTDADKEEIEEVFEFVKEESILFILPPQSKVEEYIRLIQALPEDDHLLGDYLIDSGAVTAAEIKSALDEQKQKGGFTGEILVAKGAAHKEVVEAAIDKQKQVRVQKVSTLRVDAAKLEALIDLVGELVTKGANVLQLSQKSGQNELFESTSGLYRLVEELRETALSLRMVPIGETFNRFHRVVRDISKDLGKEISLEIKGGDSELDKTVVEKINDPLMHLVRNSIDHGIETPDIRRQYGKPERGTLCLNAYHDAGNIVIEVSDDGGGLNVDRILEKAKQRGLVSSGANLSDRDIFKLVFEPGFSTADEVSNLSGRGVGMDVVKRNIEGLRGTVDIKSEPEKGTTVMIRLPLTLAIIDGFLVKIGQWLYVIPLDMVVECVELTKEDRENAHGRDYVNLRGEVLPFIQMRHYFDVNGSSDRENIVVIKYAGTKSGLVVDELMGEIQTVIKPLGKIFQGLRGVSGATILGGGEVALILDVPGLVHMAAKNETEGSSEEPMSAEERNSNTMLQ